MDRMSCALASRLNFNGRSSGWLMSTGTISAVYGCASSPVMLVYERTSRAMSEMLLSNSQRSSCGARAVIDADSVTSTSCIRVSAVTSVAPSWQLCSTWTAVHGLSTPNW